ncbi:MAG: hypothetical protein RBT45_01230 [Acholeplasmataceae bacterium]|jgi:hypothetical protein|nr:hypothetical protein [Acholeplasmataceae bacterium]
MIKNIQTIGQVLVDIKKQMKDINMSTKHNKNDYIPKKSTISFKSITGNDVFGYYYKFSEEARPTIIFIENEDLIQSQLTHIVSWLSCRFNVFVMQFSHGNHQIICEQEKINSLIHMIEFYQHASSYSFVDKTKMIVEGYDPKCLSTILSFIEPYIVIIKHNSTDLVQKYQHIDLSCINMKTLLLSVVQSNDTCKQITDQITTPHMLLCLCYNKYKNKQKIDDDIISYCMSYTEFILEHL